MSQVHNCKSAPCHICGSQDGSGNPLPDLGWVTIPTAEFEALHWEIRNGTASLQALQRGYNDLYTEAKRSELEAEALIALLRIQIHEHDPQSCGQCSGHPLDA